MNLGELVALAEEASPEDWGEFRVVTFVNGREQDVLSTTFDPEDFGTVTLQFGKLEF